MPQTITPKQFVEKWSAIQQKEIAVAQSHFFDVCALVNHPRPLDFDPTGKIFAFEATTTKSSGSKGRADVFYRDRFIWEYKGVYSDLDKAYDQLNLYRDALGNPPLLITSDTQRIIIHTNFTNTVKRVHEVDFESLLTGNGLTLLKRAFYNPETFKPDQTQEQVTLATSNTFVKVAETLQKWAETEGRTIDPEKLAHFIIRLLFCLFAEDMKLLPDHLFTKMVSQKEQGFNDFVQGLRSLFATMRDGGYFGFYRIPHFDGGLFDDDFVPSDPPSDIKMALLQAAKFDWSNIDPSIFGTLFERIIDQSKRAQLGAHYTSKDDIMLIVQPVLMAPLRREWQAVKQRANQLIKKSQPDQAYAELKQFADTVASIRVLDPACGSGNFLYVALRQLLDLQKEVIVMAKRAELPPIDLTVSPAQLYGIELNSYAHELAQITVWIGYLQWRAENGFSQINEPILQPLKNIENRDAILAHDGIAKIAEPEWPEVYAIIGNPPFLGAKWMHRELGMDYTNLIRELYKERVSGMADLVMYWFEKARFQIQAGKAHRAGFLATNTVRQGGSADTLLRIKGTGDIFFAFTDKVWQFPDAALRVALIGFDNGTEKERHLNGGKVNQINADLTSNIDLKDALKLEENLGLSFRGHEKGGPFVIDQSTAQKFLQEKQNSDVIHPWFSGRDLTARSRNEWVIDFGTQRLNEAKKYPEVLDYIQQQWSNEYEAAKKKGKRVAKQRKRWWLHRRPATDLRTAITGFERYIATPLVSKYRLFVWLDAKVRPDTRLVNIAREDDYFFGILHSRIHELWSLKMGSRIGKGNDPIYTNSNTFETFPFPWIPGKEPTNNPLVKAITQAAKDLVEFRQSWLHPNGVGITISAKLVKKRTLTNLYNALTLYRENYKGKQHNQTQWENDVDGIISLGDIETLDYIHNQLDEAVFAAYGWSSTLSDDETLGQLLALNLDRGKQKS